MNPTLKEILEILALLGIPILTFHAGRNQARANANKTNRETEVVSLKAFQDLVKQVNELTSEQSKLHEAHNILLSSNRALWSYVYALIDFIKDKKLVPPTPPAELDTDPRLARLLGRLP
jgi:hypothetical protein